MPERLGLRLTGRLTLLVATMRAGGARIGVDELRSAHRALAAIAVADRRATYLALRPVLCSCHADLETFDAAFEEWFGPGRLAPRGPEGLPIRPSRRLRRAARRGEQPTDARPDLQRTLRASLRHDGEPLARHWRKPAERPRP